MGEILKGITQRRSRRRSQWAIHSLLLDDRLMAITMVNWATPSSLGVISDCLYCFHLETGSRSIAPWSISWPLHETLEVTREQNLSTTFIKTHNLRATRALISTSQRTRLLKLTDYFQVSRTCWRVPLEEQSTNSFRIGRGTTRWANRGRRAKNSPLPSATRANSVPNLESPLLGMEIRYLQHVFTLFVCLSRPHGQFLLSDANEERGVCGVVDLLYKSDQQRTPNQQVVYLSIN